MPLARLAGQLGLGHDPAYRGIKVTGVTLDSRAVRPGDLFAALPGTNADGATFVPSAVAAGAVAVLAERSLACAVPVLAVADPRAVLGSLAATVYGEPSRGLTMLGITGTNGKTTTAYLLDAALRACGRTTALLGTVETKLAGERLPAARTTPEAPELQAILATARERGVEAVAMEVSSHALALHRVDGMHFAVSVFTNLSQDHLDFHADLEDYFAAKARLFDGDLSGKAVVCVDDGWGRRLAELLAARERPVVTVAGVDPAAGVRVDWLAEVVHADARGSRFVAHGPAGASVEVQLQLPGGFNVTNALCALATGVAVGLDPQRAAAGIAGLAGIPGRLEPVEGGQPYTALVDYAHTPAAVMTLLSTLRPLTLGRLVVVLGCGGDRDRGKRPLMARAAAAGADLAVLTSDNPRSERPQDILAEMVAGLAGSSAELRAAVVVEPDRAAAIAMAIDGLGVGDTVVVAGKGHETGQEVAGRVLPFDDRLVLMASISRGSAATTPAADSVLR